jgi:hypothetical protein
MIVRLRFFGLNHGPAYANRAESASLTLAAFCIDRRAKSSGAGVTC